ncbi:glycerophosphodiester phosphodiesterase [Bacillus sp. B15-48]|uniref:glycerophosphodiester phosphodiesterase n=1 Tax=Bacillus sp. B15-48 TaxID=1548601 RepID=UPI00193F44B3|nr:glycerophosphodiester phosphodiesterase [Bacillus sp. B15-48]MBM4762232.1 glycerophosphodiester phosphodiesterase [Bacillus sp. B15-48]
MTEIFAHRGYSGKYPENTMKAFIEAERVSADGLELDVQMTKDGEIVVIHDEKVDRTTGGNGYVKDYTAKEIRKLDASLHNKKLRFGKKEPIPFLKEVFEWLSTTNLICNVELKNNRVAYHGMEEKVFSLIDEYGVRDRVIISSFNHYSLVYVKRLDRGIETAPILPVGLYMPWVYAQSIQAKGFHPIYIAAHDEIIKKSLEQKIAIRPYTVNKEKDMERLIISGCTAIITDFPARAVKLRTEILKKKP